MAKSRPLGQIGELDVIKPRLIVVIIFVDYNLKCVPDPI
jgi:hypothetical protein